MNLLRLETLEAAIVRESETLVCDLISRFYTLESPNIRNIRIGDRYSDNDHHLPRISPLSHLPSVVSLVLSAQVIWYIDSFIQDLALMKTLESLEIYNSPTYHYGPEERHPRTVIPNLTKLVVAGWLAWQDTERFLDVISLPSLKVVKVGPKFELSGLNNMLAASGSRLSQLAITLHPVYPDWTDLASLLSSTAVEQLQELTLVTNVNTKGQTDIMEKLPFLNVQANSTTLTVFPFSLTSLTIIGWDSYNGSIGQLASSLLEHGTILYLYVEVIPGTLCSYEQDSAAIRTWKQLGFDVHLRERLG